MITTVDYNNEQLAAAAFNRQSENFDELYSSNAIIHYKRKRVRDHLLKHLKPGSSILELNAGTGEDAVFLAHHGYTVHATDISEGMQEKLMEKVGRYGLNRMVSSEVCSFTALEKLKNRGPFDCIFSNFAGLNCTGDLDKVLGGFDSLLKPGGMVVLVLLPRFCLWETLLLFRGKFKTATRRFFSSKGRKANIEGLSFKCWYYSPKELKQKMSTKYASLELEGLCTIVPPSYLENFPEKFHRVYLFLCSVENKFCKSWPWKSIGDYFIATFRKK
ncbi:MAG TPA: class I SAM-dependent methyltransferase [Chitinophagaceae bacterium]